MTESTYNSYLLHTCKLFGIVVLQTDNTLMLSNNILAAIKEKALKMAKFMTKEQSCFLSKITIKLNSTWIYLTPNRDITLSQKTVKGGII